MKKIVLFTIFIFFMFDVFCQNTVIGLPLSKVKEIFSDGTETISSGKKAYVHNQYDDEGNKIIIRKYFFNEKNICYEEYIYPRTEVGQLFFYHKYTTEKDTYTKLSDGHWVYFDFRKVMIGIKLGVDKGGTYFKHYEE